MAGLRGVYPLQLDLGLRFADGSAVCSVCTYPYWGLGCDNPACIANPTMTDDRRWELYDANQRRLVEEAERQRWAAIRDRAFQQANPNAARSLRA